MILDRWRQLTSLIRQYLFPRVVVRVREDALQLLSFSSGVWKDISLNEVPSDNPFKQQVLLVPDELTLFRFREFPANQIPESNLSEAVLLDTQLWSPWDKGYDCYFWPINADKKWLVAVWIWQKQDITQLSEQVASATTHKLPERAWKIAALKNPELPVIFADTQTTESYRQNYLVLLSKRRVPVKITALENASAVKRFFIAEGQDLYSAQGLSEGCQKGYLLKDESVRDSQLEEDLAQAGVNLALKPAQYGLPTFGALKYGREENVKDWTDPSSWVKPVSVLLGVYLIWLLGSCLILWGQSNKVSSQVASAQVKAANVIAVQDNVLASHQRLQAINGLRKDQVRLENLLGVLSVHLPKDAWLESMQYDIADGGWLEISGFAKQSTSLAALLEELPEIEHASFLSDIRKDPKTGLDAFKIRLKLAASES